jgi:hypothetical protein
MSQDNSDKKIELKKNIGVFGGASLIIGVIIGSGIFVSPKVTTKKNYFILGVFLGFILKI